MQKTPLQASLLVESDDAFFIKKSQPIRRVSESVNAPYTGTLNEMPPSLSPVCKHPSAPLLLQQKKEAKKKSTEGFKYRILLNGVYHLTSNI